ncbi:NADP-specific glutamate dehydrogenase [Pikeienuella sp. HZG-20]|uniref:NADP-specific glutamate dehydrogenase n=1 Tax=Paludibacillus litoralis TaxID=3133267 RepID=UPI0030EE74A2
MTVDLSAYMDWVVSRNPGEAGFHQAVHEMARIAVPYVNDNPVLEEIRALERLTEPDRTVSFRVTWETDGGEVRVNRGFRVQFNNAIGPYRGGIRFHPSVNQNVLKRLGFEQVFKNSLTGLAMGGAKGGADFDPKGCSRHEIMRFCQNFALQLGRHIGADRDIPTGDIGVGAREIGYMAGQYKRITGLFDGVSTGAGLEFGGAPTRSEATGHGAVYFLEHMMNHKDDGIDGKTAVISGSGAVALHAAEKLLHRGGRPITLSDSGGFIHDPDGFTQEKIDWVKRHKARRGARISAYVAEFGGAFHAGRRPWGVPCEIALPCATQDELSGAEADILLGNGCAAVCEGANMPCDAGAVGAFRSARILYAPGKAANAGGVGMSGLGMSQGSAGLHRSEDDRGAALERIMADIHGACVAQGAEPDGHVDYTRGANIVGFRKVADAMLAFGVV